MTEEKDFSPFPLQRCLGLPVEQALAICRAAGQEPDILYTGERAAQTDFTPRVIAFRKNTLIAAYFRDGDPREEA